MGNAKSMMPLQIRPSLPRPSFAPSTRSSFADELHEQARAYLQRNGDHRYASAATAWKAAALAMLTGALFIASLHASNGVAFIVAFLAFSVSAVLLSMNVSHDAAHGALFRSRALNATAARLVTISLGIEPVYWRVRHVRYHHPNANIEHCDLDTAANAFLRQTPFQPWYPQFRFQQYYWPVIAALSMSYIAWVYDWSDRLGVTPLSNDRPLPGLGGWLCFVGSKLAHLFLCLAIPLCIAGPKAGYGAVVSGYLLGQMVASGILLTMILGTHWAGTRFYDVSDGTPLPHTREEHIFLTCCDWTPRPRFLGSLMGGLVGGLNLHLTHHLFPAYSHRHYPALASIVEQLAARHGLRYRCLSYGALLGAQYRFLKSMGERPETLTA